MPIESYSPSAIGALWNNAGTLSVHSVNRMYNEGTAWVDLDASMIYMTGFDSVQFDVESVEYRGQAIYFDMTHSGGAVSIKTNSEDDGLDLLRIRDGVSVIAEATFERKDGTYKLNISSSGNSIEIDGVAQTLTYSIGNSSIGVNIGTVTSAVLMNNLYPLSNNAWVGYFSNLIFKDGETELLNFSDATVLSFVDSVESATGSYEEHFWVTQSNPYQYIGFSSNPFYTLNRALPEYPDSPFDSLPIDLSDRPSDNDRAYLRERDSKTPIIMTGTPDWSGYTADEIEWNPNCWYDGKAKTAFSVLSEWSNAAMNSTLVSPRHVILAEHVRDDYSGDTWKKNQTFMQLDGTYQTEKVIDYQNIAGTDVTIGYLENEISIDVEYAKFLSDADNTSYDYRDVNGCGPSKEGIFSIETLGQMIALGLEDVSVGSSDMWYWSRYNNALLDTARIFDSQRPAFIYHGDTLFLQSTAFLSDSYPYFGQGNCIYNEEERGYSTSAFKTSIETAMDALDDRNGGTPHYNLQIGVI